METINVAEAKSRFSELISRAGNGERFLIQRRENDPDLSTLAEKIADDRTKASTRPTIDI